MGLQQLQAKIRGFEAAGTTLTNRASKLKGMRRHQLQLQKRRLARYTRLHLLAYGLLRGLQYAQLEKCSKNNGVDVAWLLKVVEEHNVWSARRGYRPLKQADVQAWLQGTALGKPFVAPTRPQEKPVQA
jgi:hypothetical protein